jgi:putative ABC transport system permease protein
MKKVKTIFRSLRKNSRITIINIVSMALGLVSTGIILGYIFQEFNYDNGNPNSDRIYRLIQKNDEMEQAYTYAPLAKSLKSDFPEVEDAVRVSFFNGYMACSTEKNKFNENSVIFADPEFFEFFSFPLIKGNVKECLSSPNSIVISESAACIYFGKDNPLGENMKIGEEVFTVTGIFQNFIDNSNFKGELILPLAKISKLTQIWIEPSWKHESEIHTFVLLTNNYVIESLSVKARNFISKYISESKTELLFQALSNIHVNKKLDWESKSQVNVKYLYILLIVALLILCVSITNFLFLYIGTAEQRTTEIGIKKVFGASRILLFFDYLIEILILMLFSVLTAILLYVFYDNYLVSNLSFAPNVEIFDFKFILGLIVIIISVTLLAGIYPSLILSSQKPVNLFSPLANHKTDKILLINILVIGQLTLCIALISFTLLMHKQTNYMVNKDTGFAKDELITIP